MEHVPLTPFLLLTLLQLCRTELTQVLPGPWFSANAINDEFSPKPISELFSTEAPPFSSPSPVTFSQTDPIVVLPHSSSPEFSSISSFFPTVKTSTFPSTYSTQFTDLSSSTPPPSTLTKNLFPSSSPMTPSTMQTPTFIVDTTFSQVPKEETPTVRIVPPSSSTQLSTLRELFSSTREFPSSSTELPSSSISLSSLPSIPSGPSTMPPNYFIIYQQAPQNIQGTPPNQIDATVNPPSTISTPSTPLVSQISSTISSTIASTTPTPSSTPFTISIAPSTTSLSSSSAITANPCNTVTARTISTVSQRLSSTNAPALLPQRTVLSTKAPGLIIRVVAPKGSITNLKINPSSSTPRPRTKKTKKPKRNTYDLCLNSCRGKNPICTVPVGTSLIDPKTLKDFPSICHMACHNSYRNQAYEKLADSRCSRLRTRIMSVGSNQKLRREELRKSEYSIVNPESPTLLEVVSQNRR